MQSALSCLPTRIGARAPAASICCCPGRRPAPSPPRPSPPRRRAAAPAAAQGGGALVGARRRAEGAFVAYYAEIEVDTLRGISLHELTPLVRRAVADSGVSDGSVVVQSRHTTVATAVNEHEARLLDDLRLYLSRLAPAAGPYLHNDLHLRHAPEGWPGGDEAWRAQEPENAHSHILACLVGASASLAVSGGELKIGQWQSVMGVELDGPRRRRWGVAVQGLAAGAGGP